MKSNRPCMIFTTLLCIAALISKGVEFRDFSGVNQGAPTPQLDKITGWDRWDFSLAAYEPAYMEFNDQYLQDFVDKVATYKARGGRTILPVLAYDATWTSEGLKMPYRYDLPDGRRVTVMPSDGTESKYIYVTEEKKDGEWREVHRAEGVGSRLPFSPKGIAGWREYVHRAVSAMMASPCNLQYFQIWNEAWPTSGFWNGSLDDYMTGVHLTAAEVIHELGGKVVYGGWPCCGNIADFVLLMDKYDAWNSFDVADMHYMPIAAMEILRREMRLRGHDKPIWQTELGFVTDGNMIGNTYPRVLAWALKHGLAQDPDKCKLFYFAQWSPDDPKAYGYQRTLFSGQRLSIHGQSLATFGNLLDGGNITLFDDMETKPELKLCLDERLSGMEAFKVANRIVVAIHLLESNSAKILADVATGNTTHLAMDNPMVSIILPTIAMQKIAKVERIGMCGWREDITGQMSKKGDGVEINAFVREKANDGQSDYIAMPNDKLPQVFYVNVILNP